MKRKYEERLMRLPNVVGVGIGEKGGKPMIKVLVKRKVPESELQPQEVVPTTLEAYETDVEEIGGVTAQSQLQAEELIIDYFYTAGSAGGERRHRLLLNPEGAVHDAAQEMDITCNDEELAFIAAVLIETSRIATAQHVAQKQRAKQRFDQSIQALRRAFRLMLVMHNVMFYLGVALIVIGAISAFTGREIAGTVLGGVGFANLIFFLIKQPVEGIHESAGNLMQLRAAHNSYFVQLEQWELYYDYQADEGHIEIKRRAADLIHQHTKATLDLIQQYCKPISKGTGVQSDGT